RGRLAERLGRCFHAGNCGAGKVLGELFSVERGDAMRVGTSEVFRISKRATKISIAPITRLKAPVATCAVATSADLLLQMVAAPSSAWLKIRTTQTRASLVRRFFQPSRRLLA